MRSGPHTHAAACAHCASCGAGSRATSHAPCAYSVERVVPLHARHSAAARAGRTGVLARLPPPHARALGAPALSDLNPRPCASYSTGCSHSRPYVVGRARSPRTVIWLVKNRSVIVACFRRIRIGRALLAYVQCGTHCRRARACHTTSALRIAYRDLVLSRYARRARACHTTSALRIAYRDLVLSRYARRARAPVRPGTAALASAVR